MVTYLKDHFKSVVPKKAQEAVDKVMDSIHEAEEQGALDAEALEALINHHIETLSHHFDDGIQAHDFIPFLYSVIDIAIKTRNITEESVREAAGNLEERLARELLDKLRQEGKINPLVYSILKPLIAPTLDLLNNIASRALHKVYTKTKSFCSKLFCCSCCKA